MRNNFLAMAVLVLASFGAQAQVTGGVGGDGGIYATFSDPAVCTVGTPCTLTGPANSATITGGTVYSADQPNADIPKVTVGNFLAAGPTSTDPAIMTFANSVDSIGFLWGSPDTYNTLTVFYNGGSMLFTAMDLGFAFTNGDQNFSQYVTFTAQAGFELLGLGFSSNGTDAFEVSNFSRLTPTQTVAVPEPQTYALMLAGLAGVGFIARRRKQV